MSGFFGNMINFYHDRKLEGLERVTDFAMFVSMMEDDGTKTELEMAGLDSEELEFVEAEKRREDIEDAGLDSGDYDF